MIKTKGLLGLLQYFTKTMLYRDIRNLHPWTTEAGFERDYNRIVETGCFTNGSIKIAVIGPLSNDICAFLDTHYISYDKILDVYVNQLIKYDIIYNCGVYSDQCLITAEEVESQTSGRVQVLVDLFFDPENNPFRELYTEPTSWTEPVKNVGPYFDAIVLAN